MKQSTHHSTSSTFYLSHIIAVNGKHSVDSWSTLRNMWFLCVQRYPCWDLEEELLAQPFVLTAGHLARRGLLQPEVKGCLGISHFTRGGGRRREGEGWDLLALNVAGKLFVFLFFVCAAVCPGCSMSACMSWERCWGDYWGVIFIKGRWNCE